MRTRKPPQAIGLNEPFRHADHPRPTTRRQFVAQGFLTGAATILGPSLLGLLADPRVARAALASDIQQAVTGCGLTPGAGKVPFISFELAGAGKHSASKFPCG